MNAESKHFAVTTSLNHCKETITGASDSFVMEAELCLTELSHSRLPGNLRVMQKNVNSVKNTPRFLWHVAVISKAKHPAPNAAHGPQETLGAAKLLGDIVFSVVSDMQQEAKVEPFLVSTNLNLHQNHYLNRFVITFSVEILIFFLLFSTILLNSLTPVDHYRNQYLISCRIIYPFHRLASRELPATSI